MCLHIYLLYVLYDPKVFISALNGGHKFSGAWRLETSHNRSWQMARKPTQKWVDITLCRRRRRVDLTDITHTNQATTKQTLMNTRE
ncbi:hypothetical protein EYC84_002764 [Monilinia fructicola]|uniref:Uncharacterized protein n=1 Tax=Monilinia fructicola TaxID=38448 RepID=A0A5M9JUH7_MONFR|nr:hypothetical protein EYC84_002764 [Monilinia fructicola]